MNSLVLYVLLLGVPLARICCCGLGRPRLRRDRHLPPCPLHGIRWLRAQMGLRPARSAFIVRHISIRTSGRRSLLENSLEAQIDPCTWVRPTATPLAGRALLTYSAMFRATPSRAEWRRTLKRNTSSRSLLARLPTPVWWAATGMWPVSPFARSLGSGVFEFAAGGRVYVPPSKTFQGKGAFRRCTTSTWRDESSHGGLSDQSTLHKRSKIDSSLVPSSSLRPFWPVWPHSAQFPSRRESQMYLLRRDGGRQRREVLPPKR
ncbi:hypothetical protein B0H17DRAFT_61450 [Mycena rosella]|uniref:Secreted protein n=1 Tax=Mycena rosella TaxID=1033263 RepID=A0AAD7D6L9_MYCRO|nr:hypothetical protein B0H17DRAFT_61450 [Mycena rosella]